MAWVDSRKLDISKLTVLTDRGTEFNCLDAVLKNHVRTAAYSPYSNGKVERIHKEVSALCRLYDTTPDQIAELWRSGTTPVSLNMNRSQNLQIGDLVLRYIQKVQSKVLDCWQGPYLVQEIIGNRMVRALNLETLRTSVLHFNDIKAYSRTTTYDWKLNPILLQKLAHELGISNIDDFERMNLKDLFDKNVKDKDIFLDINNAADLEEIYEIILKVYPKRVLIILPEFRERDFWWKYDNIAGEMMSVPDDSDSYLINDSVPAGFRIWKSWLALFDSKQLKVASNLGSKSIRTLSSGELMNIRLPEDDNSNSEAVDGLI
jgi:hypothetical protein